jgi:hypothetical protein
MPLVDHVVLLELSERTLGCCAFRYAIVTADAAEYAFAKHFNRHSHTPSIGEFFGFAVDAQKVSFVIKTTCYR